MKRLAMVCVLACGGDDGVAAGSTGVDTDGTFTSTEPTLTSTEPSDSDDSSGPPPEECDDPQETRCGDACVDVDNDPMHCGDCDTVCPAEATCDTRECVCPEGTLFCADACVDTARDEQHCGGCDQPCDAGQPCLDNACVTATVQHILITGQSLSEGATSNLVSTKQPYDNVMFVTGVRAGGSGLDSLVPLVETDSGDGRGETIASGSANLLHELADPLAARVLASAHGVGGQPYSALMKGTTPYANGMAQVAAGQTLATAMGDVAAVRAVAVIHGESDHIGGNALYDQNLLQWQADYEADVLLATGQTLPVPMFYCQMSSFTAYGQSTSIIPGLQLAAADARPDRMYVIGPKYFLPYTDGVHLSGDGTRWLGEFYAKAFARVLVEGLPWLPLRPRAVSREGAAISIEFDVPVPPLVLDETMITNPGNYGFEYTDDSGAPPAIATVELVDDITVVVTLASEPVGENPRIRYAFTGVAGQPGGATTGARGNLRDSDATPSRHGYALYNWAVHFEELVR